MGLMRFLLALSVAVSHLGGPFQVFNSRYAVQTFYVASGFLIAMILAEKYQHNKWLFYSNRATRIFVPYWIVLLPTVAFCAWKQVGFWANISAVDQLFDFGTWAYVVLTNLFLLGQDVGLFLGWSEDSQLYFTSKFYESRPAVWRFQAIPQAWTVSLELCFYLLAPFVLRSNTVTLVCLCVLTFLMRVFAFEGGLARDPWTYRFFPFELGYFLLGALAYRASTVNRVRVAVDWSPRLIPALACMIVLGVLIGWGRIAWITSISSFTTYYGQPIGLFVLIALLCPLLLRFSTPNRWDRWLGELSYPIYIVHYSVIWALGVWPLVPRGSWGNLAIVLGLSAAVAFFVEGPVNRWRQRRVARLSITPDANRLKGLHS